MKAFIQRARRKDNFWFTIKQSIFNNYDARLYEQDSSKFMIITCLSKKVCENGKTCAAAFHGSFTMPVTLGWELIRPSATTPLSTVKGIRGRSSAK